MSIVSRLAGLLRSRRLDTELDAEIRSHIEMRTETNLAEGMTREEARRDALRRFGNPAWMKEETRRADILPWLETVVQDARYALRTFRNSPLFTASAVVTLALGIGANTAVFSVLRAVLLRPLPYPHAERLVRIDEVDASGDWGRSGMTLKGVSPPDLLSYREQNHSFEQLGGWTGGSVTLSGTTEVRRVQIVNSTYNLFSVLGVRPVAGREFLPDDEVAGGNHVAIVSHSLAQALAADVIGSSITLDAQAYTVIGIMPRGFAFPLPQEPMTVWTPMTLQRDPRLRAATYLTAIGRLKPGVTPAQAKTDLDLISARAETPANLGKSRWVTEVVGLKDDYTGNAKLPLTILAAAVGLVLLIATANVASLCLSRAAARQKEIAVRLALGATRRRLLRQLLTESVVLAVFGGIAGIALAWWARQGLLSIAPASLPLIAPVQVDWAVLLFTTAVALATGVAAGLAPAIRASGFDINSVMKTGANAFRPGNQALHGVFIVGELALAAILLCGAGLMVRTLAKLSSVDPGFTSRGLLTAELSLPAALYPHEPQQLAFLGQVLERLRALPGVQAVSASTGLPMGGTRMVFHLRVTNPGQPDVSVISWFASVTPDYFRALGVPLVRGRFFTDADSPTSQTVAIVNESLARQRWPGEDPIGKTIANGFTKEAPVVVGVVRDIRQQSLDTQPNPELYVSFAQRPWPFLRLLVRTRGADAAALAPAVRAQIQSVDRSQAVDKLGTLDELVARSEAERRFYMLLLSVFAGLALTLAAVGIFGVVAYSVAQRTREIGVRMALGATRTDVLGMIMRRAVALTTVGLAAGLGVSLGLSRLLADLLFGVQPRDPLTFAIAAAVLATVALTASYLPTRRAMRVDPLVALRYE